MCLAGAWVQAQQPAGDGAAQVPVPSTTTGIALFRSACGFCHGADAGGAQGPALTTSHFFIDDDAGQALQELLKSGRPAKGMPAFPDLQPGDIGSLRAFVHSRLIAGTPRPTLDPAAILVGDAAAGRAFFEGSGRCSTCHSPSGDLQHVGSRFDPIVLQGRIVNPRVVGTNGADTHPAQVRVQPAQGETITGSLVQINDFFVTLVDNQGLRRTIVRNNDSPMITIDDPAEAHRQMMLVWSDQDLWNTTAYLASLK
jgi:mono/diheme cytochrome c family protein